MMKKILPFQIVMLFLLALNLRGAEVAPGDALVRAEAEVAAMAQRVSDATIRSQQAEALLAKARDEYSKGRAAKLPKEALNTLRSSVDAAEGSADKAKSDLKAAQRAYSAAEKGRQNAFEKAEKVKKAAEKAAAEKVAAEKKAAEQKARQEAEAKAAAEKKELAEKRAAEKAAAEKAAAEKKAAEQKARQEAEAKAAAEKKELAEKKAAEKAAAEKAAAEKKAAELKARQEAEAKAAAEKKELAEKKATERAAAEKAAAEKKAAEQKARQEAEAKAAAEKAAAKAAHDKALADAEAALKTEREPAVTAAKAKVDEAQKALAAAQSALAADREALKKAKAEKKPDAKNLADLQKKISADESALDSAEKAVKSAKRAKADAEDLLADAGKDAAARVSADEKAAAEKAAAEKKAAELKARQEAEAKAAAEKNDRKASAENAKAAKLARMREIDAQRRNVESKRKDLAAAEANVKEMEGKLKEAKTGNVDMALIQANLATARSIEQRAKENLDREINSLNELLAKERAYDFSQDRMTPELAAAILAPIESERGIKFIGDRLWLASTRVDGQLLCDAFRKKKNQPALTLEKYIEEATKLAVKGGFYFAAFKREGMDENGGENVFVSKGRIGKIDVYFGDDKEPSEGAAADRVRRLMVKNRIGGFPDAPKIDGICIGEGSTFNFKSINENFVALNADPDIERVDIVFKPGQASNYNSYPYEVTNGVDMAQWVDGNSKEVVGMDVKVREKGGFLGIPHFHPHLVIELDNFGSLGDMDTVINDPETWMGRATLQFLNLWQRDHALTLNANSALDQSLYGFAGSYYIPREDNGRWYDLSYTLHGGYTDVNQDDIIEHIDVEGTGYFSGLNISKRILSTSYSHTDVSVGATWRHVESALIYEDNDKIKHEIAIGDPEGYEILPLSLALSYADSKLDPLGGRNFATLEGIYNIGGSSLEDYQKYRGAIEDDNYFLLRAQLARLQMLGDYDSKSPGDCWFLFARADGQWAASPLIGVEQYGLGGHGTVRGYAEREFLGDMGFSASFELRTPIFVGYLQNVLGWFKPENDSGPGWDRTQFVAFFDVGYYNLEKAVNNTEDDDEFLAGVGVGIRMAIRETFQMRLDYGIPLVKKDDDYETSDGGRFALSLSAQF